MKGKILLLISTLCFVMFVGCATSIPVNIQRPSALDLGDAETVCVVPFKLQEFDDNIKFSGFIINFGSIVSSEKERKEEVLVSTYITKQLTSKLVNSDCYKLVDSAVVEAAIKEGREIPVDIYLTGKIDKFSEDVIYDEEEYIEDDETKYRGFYKKSVWLEVTYQVVNAKDNSIISYKPASYTVTSNEYERRSDLPNAYSVIEMQLNNLVEQIYRDIHPYTETKYLQLKSDKSKNPDFKIAQEMAKNGLTKEAQEKFSEIYSKTQNFEAGYNAAILMQVNGDLNNSYDLMKELSNVSSDKQVFNALKDIQFEIDSAKKLQLQNAARSMR
jgi:hypothetical protein